jgi:hypothetical protein
MDVVSEMWSLVPHIPVEALRLFVVVRGRSVRESEVKLKVPTNRVLVA